MDEIALTYTNCSNLGGEKRPIPSAWSEERTERLKALREQKLSGSAMAAELGITRSAVMGKLHRLGLSAMSQPAVGLRPHKPRRSKRERLDLLTDRLNKQENKPVPPWKLIEPAPLADANIPLARRRTFAELGRRDCKWPVGDPQSPDFLFCGATRVDGRPYCAPHCRLAYRASPRRGYVPMRMRRAA